MNTPTVRVRGLDHSFGERENVVQVLNDIELDLMAHEIGIMTGPSGSGKTTLLTLIGALRSVQRGSVRFTGRELREMSSWDLVEVRRDIGFIFQLHNLFESVSALENVVMALEVKSGERADREARAAEMLTRVGLGTRLDYKPQALSGGQRQRVAIARALVGRPRLVLADEPTAALDKDTGREIVGVLQELADEHGTTVLIVTHDNRILDVADRLINLVDGAVVSNVLVHESVKICAFLQQCPVFAKLSPHLLADLAEEARHERHEAGAFLIRQGEEGRKFFVIAEGTVDVLRETDGETLVINTLTVGDFFGEASLLTGEVRNASIRASTDTEVYTLSKDQFQAAVEASKTFEEQLRSVLFVRGS